MAKIKSAWPLRRAALSSSPGLWCCLKDQDASPAQAATWREQCKPCQVTNSLCILDSILSGKPAIVKDFLVSVDTLVRPHLLSNSETQNRRDCRPSRGWAKILKNSCKAQSRNRLYPVSLEWFTAKDRMRQVSLRRLLLSGSARGSKSFAAYFSNSRGCNSDGLSGWRSERLTYSNI